MPRIQPSPPGPADCCGIRPAHSPQDISVEFRLFVHMLAALIDTSLILFGALALVALYAANEIGHYIGVRRDRRRPAHERDLAGISSITTGMLGLLAFALGLTINIAQARFETRRNLVAQEAGAISSAWLRSKLLPDEQGQAITARVEEFAKVELAFVSANTFDVAPALIARADDLQSQIWKIMRNVTRQNASTLMSSESSALIEMFNAALMERFAFESQVPADLSWMLMAGSLLAIGAMGYHFGASGSRHMVMTSLLLVMWAGGMVLIADLNRPRIGAIRVDPSPLVWVIQSFAQPE
jgi:hypothetical protein